MTSLQDHSFSGQSPPFFNATCSSLQKDAERLISGTVALWDCVVSSIQVKDATFENTIIPISQNENSKSQEQRVLQFYASTFPSKDLRDASSAVTRLFADSEIELYSRQDMFARVHEVMQKEKENPSSSLDAESTYYLQKLHRRFQQNGCTIADAGQRHEFKVKIKRLGDLVRECNKNLSEDASGIWLGQGDLDGIPQSLIDRLKYGKDEHSQNLWLSTKVPFSGPAITNAKNESTRKRIYYAIQNRMKVNVPLFREIILLRDETARLLGYPNHATFKTADKMMQNPQVVEELLSEIRSSVAALAVQDAKELLGIKRAEAKSRGVTADNLYLWDLPYYSARRSDKEGKQDVSISEYFELQTTLAKLLELFEHLFGARFQRIDVQGREETHGPLVWYEDVQMYSVWNIDGSKESLGYAYLDLFPRDGKYTHSGHYSLQQGHEKLDGRRFYASSALVMNYIRPTATSPTLLSLNEVRKLFHELGHLLHSLFTQTKYAALHHVDQDFIEAPSLMLEQFFWLESYIKDVSFHYSHIDSGMREVWIKTLNEQERTNPPKVPLQLSDEVVRSLAHTNQSRAVQDQLKELFFATYDMLVHTPASHAELETYNFTELFNKTRADIYKVPGGEALGEGWEWGHGQTVFRNIINRYDAGYYSYILGRVFALDIFDTGFKENPSSQEAGRKYRDKVLRVGGRQPEMKTMTEYLGHAPSTRPYLAWLKGTMRDGSLSQSES
ncbi:hypothetical protein PFICI_11594 [Pestalotiopsis fici W106-1]|uniref:Peptidase M3A/M3B catalytic domain-containing protein n=1 Tax=Pestalotiopsis fici (strain W106-1 / CGMCC3.15140) TaxID=1229662 RepID=W3WST3_PESFW|nr:uncharacterized protein PFICI_11594 [Pestalotiopsis fici W106-1]ETS76207.1 hypothetical protein PFICI_11594 [Pestalotiopsis fici W106-1]